MLRRTTVAAAALLAAGALLLSACTGGTTTSPSATAGPADTDASVAVRLVLEPGNLDIRETAGAALDQILIDNVYQGLVSRTPDQKIVPALASDYTVSDDGLTYAFTLREGVKFHDGQDLTPEDVVWSLTDLKKNAAYRDSARLANVDTITADGQVVTLTLSAPDSTLLWNLTGRAGLVFKKDDTIDRKTATNGTGPFTLTDWKQGDSITFERNDAYWGTPAKVAEVVFDYIPDTQAALNGALAGELDVVSGFDANLKDQIEANGDFTLELGKSTDKGTLAMNSTTGPLADKRVRQAIRQAIDKKAIVEALGAGQTQYGPIPELDPGYEDLESTAPFDPAAAKKLLAEAGVSDLTLNLTIYSGYGTTVSQILVSNLNDVGITLKVDSVEFSTWLQDVYINKDYQLSFVLHTEARDFENWANPDYYFTYDNPKVQDLYAQSVAATDEATADDLLAQAAKIVAEDQAADWLYNGASVVAIATNVTGFPTVNTNERINLAELAKSKGVIRYALTRLALLVLGLLVASALIFLTLRVLPGDVAQLIAGVNSTPEQVAAIRERLGLDQPLVAQYLGWSGGILRGDLGTSLLTGTPVVDELVQKAQVTIPLGLLAMTVAMLIALPFGVLSAMRRGHADGTALTVGAQTIAAVPVVWAGMMLVLVFAVWLGWLPAQGFPRGGWSDPAMAFRSLLLPAITIGVIEGAMLMRFVRSATLQATGQDFVRTAAAKGLTRDQALVRHGLPTVGLSIITVLGLQVAGIIVGAVVIEQLFSLPGIGRMLVADVGNRDLPKVQGELLVLTGFVLVVGFVVDLVHRVLDPRQREAE